MSIESAEAFVERMKTDTDFAKQVIACKDTEARRALVKDAGFDFTVDELKTVMANPENEELSDAELASVAGAGCYDDWLECTFLPPCNEGIGDAKRE